MMDRRVELGIRLAAAALLVMALGHWPYGFYTFLRIAVCLCACVLAHAFHKARRRVWTAGMIGLAILFNPLIPVYLKRSDWAIIDIAAAGLFLLSGLRVSTLKLTAAHLRLNRRHPHEHNASLETLGGNMMNWVARAAVAAAVLLGIQYMSSMEKSSVPNEANGRITITNRQDGCPEGSKHAASYSADYDFTTEGCWHQAGSNIEIDWRNGSTPTLIPADEFESIPQGRPSLWPFRQ